MDRRSFLGALCAAPVAVPVALAASAASETPNLLYAEVSRKSLDVMKADLVCRDEGFEKRVLAAVRRAQTERRL